MRVSVSGQNLEICMKKYLNIGLIVLALGAVCGNAVAGPEPVTETRPIDARVTRVKLDGVIDLKLRQGMVPGLILIGERKWLDRTTTVQNGDTLNIGTEMRHMKSSGNQGLRAELILPQLREVSSESVGWTDVQGFTGDELDLALEGAGSMKVNCNYRMVTASLGGVGSMNIQGGNSDGIDLNLRGAGYVTLAGKSKWLKATLGGLGGLDAQHFYTDSVSLELSGLGNASVQAKQNASLTLSGMGSVTVYGKPLNRQVSVDGLGKVSWK
jgi:hypothetical protein